MTVEEYTKNSGTVSDIPNIPNTDILRKVWNWGYDKNEKTRELTQYCDVIPIDPQTQQVIQTPFLKPYRRDLVATDATLVNNINGNIILAVLDAEGQHVYLNPDQTPRETPIDLFGNAVDENDVIGQYTWFDQLEQAGITNIYALRGQSITMAGLLGQFNIER